MARPKPTIIASASLPNGERWEILQAEKNYVITYLGQPVNVRAEQFGLGTLQRKYKKLSYSNLGNCKAQVRKLNEIFNCNDFGYVICPT